MGHQVNKRHGPGRVGMQFWPRSRAKRLFPKINNWEISNEKGLLGFAGYKAATTHVVFIDNRKNSTTKGVEVRSVATVIECPPLNVFGIRFYKKSPYGSKCIGQIYSDKLEKNLSRKIPIPKSENKKEEKKLTPEELIQKSDNLTLIVHTNPTFKKTPEIMELGIGGKDIQEKYSIAKEKLGNQISISDVFKAGELIDTFSVTKGRGFEGAITRFGCTILPRKTKRHVRTVGTLGPWKPSKVPSTVPQGGQLGYNTRCEYNQWLLKIAKNSDIITPKGGIAHYGVVKSDYIILKGSISGSKKRLIRLRKPARANVKIPKVAPEITFISKEGRK